MSARSKLRSTRPLGIESLEDRRLMAGRVDLSVPASQLVNIPATIGSIDTTVATSPTRAELTRLRTIAEQNLKAVNFSFDPYEQKMLVFGTNANDSLTVSPLRTGETQFKLESTQNGKTVLSQTYTVKERVEIVSFDAGGGDDTFVNTANLWCLVQGGEGNDRLVGGDRGDELEGEEGNDILVGGGGIDWLSGGLGDDHLDGGMSRDFLEGDSGSDWLIGGSGDDALQGGDNDDVLLGGTGADQLFGNGGNDYLAGDEDPDELKGGEGNDQLAGGGGNDQIWAGAGNDWIWGEAGQDVLYGDAGDDRLYGGADQDVLYGDNGNDYLDGGADAARDYLFGGLGRDTYRGDWIWSLDSSRRLVKRTSEFCLDVDEPAANQVW